MRFRVLAARRGQPAQSFTIEAADADSAVAQVTGQGFAVIGADALRAGLTVTLPLRSSATFPTSLFSVELLALLKAGLNVVEAIAALRSKEGSGVYRQGLDRISDALNRGHSFAQALTDLGQPLPALFVTTLRAAEGTGAMHDALARYVAYDQTLDRVRGRVISAAIYPLVLLGVGTLVMAFLMLYVVPRFARIYDDMHQTLPLFSSILFTVGGWIGENTMTVLLLALGLGVALTALAFQPSARAFTWSQAERVPALGRWVRTFHLARLYRSLALLLEAGVPLAQALESARSILPANMAAAGDHARRRIEEGLGVAVAMSGAGLTTPIAAQLLAVGERTGELGVMMGRLADLQDDELERFLDRAMRLMEPLLMTVIGVMVGAILVIMYMPIFELAGSL